MQILKQSEFYKISGGFVGTAIASMMVGGALGALYGLNTINIAYNSAPPLVRHFSNDVMPTLLPIWVAEYAVYGALGGLAVASALSAIS